MTMPPAAALPSLEFDAVEERFDFADRRMNDLVALSGTDLGRAAHRDRQPLVQEFFFHLIGGIDVFAQYVVEQRSLSLGPENTTMSALCRPLTGPSSPVAEPLQSALLALYVNTRSEPFPVDPYDDDGYLYRAYNYRHHVTHRRANPWLFRMGGEPLASFVLDPRVPTGNGPNHSIKSYDDDMRAMLGLIRVRVVAAKGYI